MRRHHLIITIVLTAGLVLAAPAARAQTFRTYHCADGAQFIVAFYAADSSAHIQLDGAAVALPRRYGLSGARYAARGIALRIDSDGATLRRGRRPTTICAVE